jgi:hypothetical protein
MIRNAWHISGGEGWCENTTNLRVLVTHSDGRQTVEEIKVFILFCFIIAYYNFIKFNVYILLKKKNSIFNRTVLD